MELGEGLVVFVKGEAVDGCFCFAGEAVDDAHFDAFVDQRRFFLNGREEVLAGEFG